MANDFEEKWNQILSKGDSRSERLRGLLTSSDDLIGIVLRGHLVVEELLFSACAAYCADPDQLKAARLRYPQLIFLLRALEKIPAVPPKYWDALQELNSLRNTLAHQLEHKDLENKLSRFVAVVQAASTSHELARPDDSREALVASLHFLVGGLEVVALWHEGLEELMRHRALQQIDR